MDAGFQVFAAAGASQIDQAYKNLFLGDKQTVYPSSNSPTLTPFSRVTTSVPLPFFVALRPLGGIAATVWGSSTNSFTVAASGNGSVEVYIFGISPPATASYGLEVRNAANEIVFNSGYKPLRVAGQAKLPDVSPSIFGNTDFVEAGRALISLPRGKKYAGILSHSRTGSSYSLDAYEFDVWEDMVQADDTGVTAGLVRSRRFSFPALHRPQPTAVQSAGGILIGVDVTNY